LDGEFAAQGKEEEELMRLHAAGIILLATPLALVAQQSARVRGTMRDTSGNPIGDVALQLMPGNRFTRSGVDGSFGFDSLAPGKYDYTIRRLGFSPMSGEIAIRSDTILDFRLERRSQMLDTIVVTGNCSGVRFSGFLCRRSKGQGIFLTEEDILAKNPTYIADVFLDMKGFHVDPVMGPYGQYRVVRAQQSRCFIELLDGRQPVLRNHSVAVGNRIAGRTMQASLHDYYKPEHLLGIEVYPPGSKMPKEYAKYTRSTSGDCVLVNYWTGYSLPKTKKP
jgi:hypothetical protein